MGLKTETEGFIMAAQEHSLYTGDCQSRIIRNDVDPKCRMCDQYDETVDHLFSGCPVIRPTKYKKIHARVFQYIHWKIWQHYKAPYHKDWYEHKPEAVVETESATILLDFVIHKERTIDVNEPDITIKGRKNNSCLLVELMFPIYQNFSSWEFENISKCKDLEIKIGRTWHLKSTLIPVIVGALGTVKKGGNEYLQ